LKTKKKLLILIDWFPPGYKAGGPIQSCFNVSYALKDEFDLYVLTTDTDLGSSEPYSGIPSDVWIENMGAGIKINYLNKQKLNRRKLRAVIQEIDPDFIYVNSLYSSLFAIYPLWMKFREIVRGKLILCPRGALYESALSVKRYKKLPFLKLFKLLKIHQKVRFHATNLHESETIVNYFPGSEVFIAEDFPLLKQSEFKSCEKQVGEINLIFISRVHPIKNLKFAIQMLRTIKSSVHFTIIGPIEVSNYWTACLEEIEKLPEHVKVVYEGAIPNYMLGAYLQKSHLYVLPTQGENFGHSIYEAFLHGRPVLISDQTPWRNLAEYGAGWDLPLTNVEAFADVVEDVARWDQNSFDWHANCAWEYAARFIREASLKERYLQLFS
jgi:glycosyltransferase involved in cell wall biosynthesis